MKRSVITVASIQMEVISLNTIVVGSGAAAFNAADSLYNLGQVDLAMVTEGLNTGTSRNTGSDKQTYYKLTVSGSQPDSVFDMAKTLFDGCAVDGDTAMCEAALSLQAFFKLVNLGVPFPHNRYGEYVGYKTDHDPRQRATSVGPLTSKVMTEKLQTAVMNKRIPIFDGYQVIGILTDEHKSRTFGVIALKLDALQENDAKLVLFNATNVIYATGGPAGMYADSVYPACHTGSTGIALEAGAVGKNLTEWQFGLASTAFRWNLSGTYQQVLPRYVSSDSNGKNEREFLLDYFPSVGKMLDAIFLKGYQWPFDPQKIADFGSSLIDVAVYQETAIKKRRVFLDYRTNCEHALRCGELDFSLLGQEAFAYLKKSEAMFGTPFERLHHMNHPAVELYKNQGIDLGTQMLEIAVCAQHNNGGLGADLWWESNLKHLFPVGEVNGSHGVYRPGGSALNAGQVGGLRSAQYIAARYREDPLSESDLLQIAHKSIKDKVKLVSTLVNQQNSGANPIEFRRQIGETMSRFGGILRERSTIKKAIATTQARMQHFYEHSAVSNLLELPIALFNYDILICQFTYLCAMLDYIEQHGKSRGSCLIVDESGQSASPNLNPPVRFALDDGRFAGQVQETSLQNQQCAIRWRKVRPLQSEEDWFENVWNAYLNDDIIKK